MSNDDESLEQIAARLNIDLAGWHSALEYFGSIIKPMTTEKARELMANMPVYEPTRWDRFAESCYYLIYKPFKQIFRLTRFIWRAIKDAWEDSEWE